MTAVGLLYPGEMGALVAAACNADVIWVSAGRSDATCARADALGLTDAGTLAELVARSDIVLSICPPAIAEETAREVAAAGFDGLYVDANAISPARAKRIATLFERTVDGSIVGRETIHLYLSGNRGDMDEIAALFDPDLLVAIPLDGGIGAASAMPSRVGTRSGSRSLPSRTPWLAPGASKRRSPPRGSSRWDAHRDADIPLEQLLDDLRE